MYTTDTNEAEQRWAKWFDAVLSICLCKQMTPIFNAAVHSNIPALVKFGHQKRKRLDGLVVHAMFPVNTGRLEGFNNKIKVAKRKYVRFP